MKKLSDRFARRAAERRVQSDAQPDRRQRPLGGRRSTDRGRPWWQKGLFFGALCVALRCWQYVKRGTPERR